MFEVSTAEIAEVQAPASCMQETRLLYSEAFILLRADLYFLTA